MIFIGPPEGIEVRDFNYFFDFFENLNFGYVELVDMVILTFCFVVIFWIPPTKNKKKNGGDDDGGVPRTLPIWQEP